MSTTRCRSREYWKVVAGVRYDRYNASLTNSINLPPSASQNIGFTSVRAGVIFQPTATQSYYVSYGTSFNPSLETLALDHGQQSLDPETSKPVRARRQVGPDGRQPVSHRGDLPDREGQHAVADLHRGLRADRRCSCARLPGYRRRRITRKWQVFGGYTYLDAEIVKASALDGTQGKVPANTPQEQRLGVDDLQLHARMAGRHRRGLHVGSLRLQQQRRQGARLSALGRDGRVSAAEVCRSSSTCSTSPTGSTTTR